MMKNFIEMVNVRIENGDSLTIGIQYGDFGSFNSIVPDSISTDRNIHIKGEWLDMIIPKICEISYDEFEEEYIVKYDDITIYFS